MGGRRLAEPIAANIDQELLPCRIPAHPTTSNRSSTPRSADPDQLLLESLRSDERRRRRRRLLFVSLLIGGLIMSITMVAALAGWLTIAAVPAPRAPKRRSSRPRR